ncbi:MAG: M23 family metallopeptidase [Robiginitomaculum sp.]|nr:M23 family metallopeptidase [Robiginitomaculum sp.]
MFADTLTTLKERTLKTFPERQFIHRTGGKVNYFILTTRAQLIISGIIGTILLWCLFTIASMFWDASPLRSSTHQLKVQKEEFNRHLVDLDAQVTDARELLGMQQEKFEQAAESFEQKHNTIVTMLTQGRVAEKENDLNSSIYAQSKILMSPLTLDVIERQARIEFSQQTPMQTGTVLDASLTSIELDQNNILISGDANMQTRIERDRAILSATGIPFAKILKNGPAGVGGPFIALDEKGKSAHTDQQQTGGFLSRLDNIQARATEVEALDKALASVPLAFPIDAEHYLTSPYGRRKDPFTKRPTKHSGIDYASYRMAPIVATADGKVSFVGRRAGYGRVVEIKHGHGFKTRYAHLAKTYVKRGQKIEKGEKIAGMGSSGRSTSTHLHYEVFFEKRAQDPSLFIKAGKYVQ